MGKVHYLYIGGSSIRLKEFFMTSPINSGSGQFNSDYACAHNNRKGVSSMDVVEHCLRAKIAEAIRDIADVKSGYESFAGCNQEPARAVFYPFDFSYCNSSIAF
jgi:hypothetical protein